MPIFLQPEFHLSIASPGINHIFQLTAEGEHIEGVSLSHDLELDSACGLPPYTNFTIGFHGCLDYIFYQTDKFIVKEVCVYTCICKFSLFCFRCTVLKHFEILYLVEFGYCVSVVDS